MKATKNYQAYCRLLLNNSPVSVLLQVRNDLMKEQEPQSDAAVGAICKINAYTKPFRSNVKCPRCGDLLYRSDLPQYAYVCYDCDENFFDVEVVHGEVPHGDQ